MYVDSALFWKILIEQITHKLSSVCYAIRSVKPFMSHKMLKMVYYACFHSIMNCGLIFWGNSSNSTKILNIQKNIIRSITGCRSRDSCRDLLKNLKIVPLHSQYILSLLSFVVNSKNKFQSNSDFCHIYTRQKCNFHHRSSNLSLYQIGVHSIGILPQNIKN
jgi:hypothetical protein